MTKSKHELLAELIEHCVVAIVRLDQAEQLEPVVEAIAAGGVVGWTTVGSITRFVETLRAATKRMADGRADLSPPATASTKELVALRLAYLELAGNLRQRIDAERVQKEKLEELNQIKSNILSIVSHDLRTPLTSILLYAKMLEDELTDLSEQDQRHFLKIMGASMALAGLGLSGCRRWPSEEIAPYASRPEGRDPGA